MTDIKFLKTWSLQLNEVLNLQSLAEIQEEQDKQSISLVGIKEVNQSPRSPTHVPKDEVLSIDSKCMNCNAHDTVLAV